MSFAGTMNRRAFIGGSDARIIMGADEAALIRLWREKRGEIEPEDLSGNLIVQLGTCDRGAQPALVRAQQRPQGRRGPAPGPALGHSLDGRHPGRDGGGQWGGVRGQVHAALVVRRAGGGRKAHGPGPAQYVGHPCPVGGALDHHRRRQVGGNHHPDGSALSERPGRGREEILALRPVGRDAPPDQCRAAAAADRSDPHRRYDLVQQLGGICRRSSAAPGRPIWSTSGPRPSSRGLCRRTPGRPSAMGCGPNARSPGR